MEAQGPKQASLRRAVSTAYYAVFHLLIDEAVAKWAVERQRSVLARTVEHGKLKRICDEILKSAESGSRVPVDLRLVAAAFIRLQHQRHLADYDNSIEWTRTDVLEVLNVATGAFESWHRVEAEDLAQDFLLQLLLGKANKQT
jgi:uncharacterized protein (UPF0332 family)